MAQESTPNRETGAGRQNLKTGLDSTQPWEPPTDEKAMQRTGLAGLLVSAALCVACTGTAPLAPKAVDLNRAGSEALAAGDLETAEARFALALEYHPRFVEALTNLGMVEMQRGNLARARIDFERARRINPDLAQPHHALGVLAER